MSSVPPPTSGPAGGPATRRGAGRRLLLAPVHLGLALGLLTGCASGTASTVPGAVLGTVPATASPTAGAPVSTSPSPPAAPTPGTVTTVRPSPTEAPARTAGPLSGARTVLDDLPAAAGTMSDDDRDALFGGWIDADGDCEDTRNEVLARDLTGITSTDGCTVATGTLEDPCTGSTIAFVRGVATSGDVQVDHAVSLGNAWLTGARRLSPADRVALADDPLNLFAVDGPTNGSKSDLDASGWLPPEETFACELVATQIAVKARYGLWVTAPEKQAMAEVLTGCPEQQLPGGVPVGDIPGDRAAGSPPSRSPTAEGPVPSAPADVHHQNCTAAREAGAAPLHRGDPGSREAMDRDADGVACEG